MSKKKSLENRMYTAEEVEKIVEERLLAQRRHSSKVTSRYVAETSRMFNAMIEMDLSFDIIVALHDTPMLREKYTREHIKLAKYSHWQEQMEGKQ